MSDHDFTNIAPPHTPPISVSSTTTEQNLTGSWKYIRPAYHDRVAPCVAGCPTAVDVQGYMTMLREGRVAAACELLLGENPMPAVTGRVCNHPCEEDCNRAFFDGAVAIHAVERMLGDRILQTPLPESLPVTRAERIAVIGSGPAGLACAYHLRRLGYAVEVFEQADHAGGMLRMGIPEYRLPRAVLDAQIERIQALGIPIHCGFRAGADVTWEVLTRDFAAVFIATGAPISKSMGAPEPSTRALWSGLDFLRVVNSGGRPNIGKRALIVGGGNTAMDCARTALRLGAQVTLLYRRTRAEMPAIAEEVADAEREGVQFVFLGTPQRIESGARGLAVVCQRMVLGAPDGTGRRAPVPSKAAPFTIETDTVLTAIGEDAELAVLPDGVAAGATLPITEWGGSRIANIFLGGDLAGDERTVASALGAGKRAAIGIDRYFRGLRGETFDEELIDRLSVGGVGALSMSRWRDADPVQRVDPLNDVVAFEDININHFAAAPRQDDRHGGAQLSFEESNIGLTEDTAFREAARCFQCGVCNACELCLIYCGDVAITRNENGRFDIRVEYCKGCGVCALECPRGAIQMTREGL